GPRRPVELVGDVVVHVVDQQVRVSAVVHARLGAVLVVALEDRGGRYRCRRHVALAGIGVDDHAHLGRAVAMNDVVRDAVEVRAGVIVLAEVRVEPTVTVSGDDVVDDRGGAGGHRGVGDFLIPGVVGGKNLVAQERGHRTVFQLLQTKGG